MLQINEEKLYIQKNTNEQVQFYIPIRINFKFRYLVRLCTKILFMKSYYI